MLSSASLAWNNQPKTVQSQGCGKPGDYLDLPYPFISGNISQQVEVAIVDQLLRLRYGVWAGLDEPLLVTSQQYAQCRGDSAREVVMRHSDFYRRRTANFTEPIVKVTRFTTPKFVIVLENSVIINKSINELTLIYLLYPMDDPEIPPIHSIISCPRRRN